MLVSPVSFSNTSKIGVHRRSIASNEGPNLRAFFFVERTLLRVICREILCALSPRTRSAHSMCVGLAA